MKGVYKHIVENLKKTGFVSPVLYDPLYTLAKGTDAGIYRLIPQLVIQVNNEQEVISVLEQCRNAGVPVTFKAGGTSLCGQTVTNSVLMETGPGFNRYSINHNGTEIKLQPGITGSHANAVLAKYLKKIGPGPASIASAKIGGIIANNASGAGYGIASNSYHTLNGLRVVFYDGKILDTADPNSRHCFAAEHENLMREVSFLSQHVKQNPVLSAKIRHKYELKNTTGYGLNSLLDFNDPVDILWHLMIGSEGTLGFISEATFNTVDSFPHSAVALVLLPDIREACKAIVPLRKCIVNAAELMDRNALRSVQDLPGIPSLIRNLDDQAVALLIDTAASDKEVLEQQIAEICGVFNEIRTEYPVAFIKDVAEYNRIWKVRKGLFTSAAATRPPGTSCLIEDVAFRAGVLGDAVVALRDLIVEFGYKGSVMWGHLLDGNIHFVIMPDFRELAEVEKYRRFMEKFVHLTVHGFDGSLKAEHGTGRNMAPFVKDEWGDELYDIMQKIKSAVDPENVLNPGVILNDDPLVHIKNLKPIPEVNEVIDKCIECGFCENDCPSKNLSLTPRQRIVAYRAIYGTHSIKDMSAWSKTMTKAFAYHADATCATDGLCGLACPVDINTGKLIKELRFYNHGVISHFVANYISNHMDVATASLRSILNLLWVTRILLGKRFMSKVSKVLHYISGSRIPLWNEYMPSGADLKLPPGNPGSANLKVVYFPTCINRAMGKSADYLNKEVAVVQQTIQLLQKAGFQVIIPKNVHKLCCGMAFDSKGFTTQGITKARQLEEVLLEASDGGSIPVYCDMSPCLLRMKETMTHKLQLYEPVEFIMKFLINQLSFTKLPKRVAVHSTCSTTKLGLNQQLIELASMCCLGVVVPDEIGCCGWAGDRGFSIPELNVSALKGLKQKIPADIKEGYSTSRTCEIGLTLNSGVSYKSIIYLVDEATVPKTFSS